MAVAAAFSAVLALLPGAPPLPAEDREAFAVAIVPALGHRVSDERAASILSLAAAAFRARTMLSIDETSRLPAPVIERCRAAGGYLCWTLAYRELSQETALLLLLSVGPDENGRDRLSAVLLDAARARAIHDAAARGTADWREAAEDAIFNEAVLAESAFRGAADVDETRVYFGKLVNEDLRAALEKRGRWTLPGSVRLIAEQETAPGGVRAPAIGATVRLGEPPGSGELDVEALRKIGFVEGPETVIAEVRPGERVIALTKPDCMPAAERVRVFAKAEVEARILISCPPRVDAVDAAVPVEDEPGLWSSPWFYAGAAVVAVVAGGVAVAMTLPDEQTRYRVRF